MLNAVFILFPALVAGHGFMLSPEARTGDLGADSNSFARSPKLSPWADYRERITDCGVSGNQQNAIRFPRGADPSPTVFRAGTPQNVVYDVSLAHPDSLNHMRIAYRTYTMSGTTATVTSQFTEGVLLNVEDTAADRAANTSPTYTSSLTSGQHTVSVTIPANAPAGPAELQWMWASERDGAGGFYISCADIMIESSTVTTPITDPPTPALGTLTCYDGAGDSATAILCGAGEDRCMSTWQNDRYFYRCAERTFCQDAINAAGSQTNHEVTCCETDSCNIASIVPNVPNNDSSATRLTSVGLFGFLGYMLLLL